MQVLRGQGNVDQRRGLSKGLHNFKNFVVSLIISLFILKLYNFYQCRNKCKSLSLDKFFILGTRS